MYRMHAYMCVYSLRVFRANQGRTLLVCVSVGSLTVRHLTVSARDTLLADSAIRSSLLYIENALNAAYRFLAFQINIVVFIFNVGH